jgi:beta-lactamase class A
LQNLEILLKQTLEINDFEGIAGVYLQDMQTGQELHFATLNGDDIPVEPDVAFTASSIIKIPIMISAFRRMDDNPDLETLDLVSKMIDLSGNEAADWLMERVIDPVQGPLLVSEDMESLGLQNTFLAGKFTLGSPLLRAFNTPANTRADVNTDPDPYSQTTTSDIGMLLADLYQCAQNGGGTLPAVFPGQINEAKCQTMVNYLVNNKLPSLLTAGIPEGTQIAHKHGWVTTNGVIRTIGDAGIIYSPGGSYVLVIFFYNPDQLIWDPASILMADLSQAVFNYYNLPQS